ncbi:MAG: hypothetical protein ACREMA_04780 [Longimicrobiales bacterium]
MRRTLGVSLVLLLLAMFYADSVSAQQQRSTSERSRLKGNYPNPFNPTTKIVFTLFEEDFKGGRPAVVSIIIYNQLRQRVAIPQAWEHPNGSGALIDNLAYPYPKDWIAYWDGTDRTGNKVASGIYTYIVTVNGVREQPRRMVVSK